MNLRQLDLNLLLVMDAMLKHRNATVVAERLGVSQPTVSAALRKLRDTFDDPLFVKRARGMEPTPRALEMQAPLAEIVDLIGRHILAPQSFDPATSERTFTLLTGDVGQIVFVRRILPVLRREAPHATFRIVGCGASERRRFLEEGRADLAMGHMPAFRDTVFYQQRLYADPMVCVLRADHPAWTQKGMLTLDAFSEAEHAVIGTEGDYHHLYESLLQAQGIERRVVVELANVSAAPYVLADSDLIAVLPAQLAQLYCRGGTLRMAPAPVSFPACEVRQYWTAKLHRDPALVWFRRALAACCQEEARP